MRLNLFKRCPRRFENEREGDHRRGNDCALPGEDKLNADAVQPAAEGAAAAKEDEQIKTEHGRRHHHRQGEEGIEQFATGEAAAGEEEAAQHAEDEADGDGADGDFEREQKRGEDGVHGLVFL